jgi:hypothetical protein
MMDNERRFSKFIKFTKPIPLNILSEKLKEKSEK